MNRAGWVAFNAEAWERIRLFAIVRDQMKQGGYQLFWVRVR